jgi:GIY-YIG catalytic domain
MDAHDVLDGLVQPARLWSRGEVLERPSPVPSRPGVYGWYFRALPWRIDTSQCVTWGSYTLLYGGIAPKAPPANGRPASQQTLRKRIRYHYTGNAAGSTLRLTLGCLLAERLGIQLRRVGSGRRLTFAAGEARLSAWMADNAYVTWVETDRPWLAEQRLIASVNLPLNLDQNRHHAFHQQLTQARADARMTASTLPIVST